VESVPLAQAIKAIKRVIYNGGSKTMMTDMVVAVARLGNVLIALEDFLESLADAALLALDHALAQMFTGDLAVEMHLKLRKRLSQRVALGLVVVVAAEDRVDALSERLGGLGDGILVALAQKDFAILAGPGINS
jgi:hypothetical protein